MLELSSIGVLTAFAAGVISFLSPCVLPLVPGYVSYVAGESLSGPQKQQASAVRPPALGLSTLFVLGFSTVFVVLGASATALGQLLIQYRYETNIAGGAIIIAFGLFMTGMLNLRWLHRDFRFHAKIPGGRPVGAYVLGLAFAFGWTPCIGPVLGAILTMSAATATVSQGIALLAIYSLGLGLPFLIAAAFTGGFLARMGLMRRFGRPLQIFAGLVMVAMGIAMMTGYLSAFSFWILEAFPGLATIG
ncbi:MAG: cytochrome c biogenesis protein CcdA [Rhodospirillales bacterium]|nr:cytochrome c biogenesis protein CcdA [Rhodospirillales bacterium]